MLGTSVHAYTGITHGSSGQFAGHQIERRCQGSPRARVTSDVTQRAMRCGSTTIPRPPTGVRWPPVRLSPSTSTPRSRGRQPRRWSAPASLRPRDGPGTRSRRGSGRRDGRARATTLRRRRTPSPSLAICWYQVSSCRYGAWKPPPQQARSVRWRATNARSTPHQRLNRRRWIGPLHACRRAPGCTPPPRPARPCHATHPSPGGPRRAPDARKALGRPLGPLRTPWRVSGRYRVIQCHVTSRLG